MPQLNLMAADLCSPVLASAGSHVAATAAIDRVSCGAQIRHFSEITERQILVFRVNNLHQEIERAA